MLDTLTHIWLHLGWPLFRLLIFLGLGLLIALLVETLGWTRRLAMLAEPMTRYFRLPQVAAASFSLCFASGMAANTLLSESYLEGRISKKELILANLFNSLPSNLIHLPTTFFIMVPIIKTAAFIYLGLTLAAAFARTLVIGMVARKLLAEEEAKPETDGEPHGTTAPAALPDMESRTEEKSTATREETTALKTLSAGEASSFRAAWMQTQKRFKKRMRKIALYTAPIYTLFFFLNEAGFFAVMERFMSAHLDFLSWISPQAISIITFQVASEFTAGVAAAGALLESGTMLPHEVVLALLAGNVLSSPVRTLRHQYPYFAGIFQPRLAAELICCAQAFRAFSIVAVTLLYLLFLSF